MSTPLIVLVDDDPANTLLVESALQGLGRVRAATSVDAARPLLRQRPDIALVDLGVEGDRGEEVIDLLVELTPGTTFLALSSVDDVERAVAALQRGADDYLKKPVEPARLRRRVEEVLVRRRLVAQVRSGGEFALPNIPLAQIQRGPSRRSKELAQQIQTVADTDMTVLITGETGVGKELVAHAVHRASRRRDRPFVTVNCGALPRELIEAELFGHTEGAFTGATGPRQGLVREADGGTLFLDEVAELPLALQPKLLRFLQEGEVRPVGSDRTWRPDVRVVAATHRDPRDAVASGLMREDLMFRLSVLVLAVAPLRDRAQDIPVLAEEFLREAADRAGRQVRGFDKEALRTLMAEPWPGNVRELKNRVQRAVVFCRGDHVTVADLGFAPRSQPRELPWTADLFRMPFGDARDRVLVEFERAYVGRALADAGGNVAAAARRAGLPRKSFWRVAQRVGLAADRASRRAGQMTSPDEQPPADPMAGMRTAYLRTCRELMTQLIDRLAGTPRLDDWGWARSIAQRLRGSAPGFGLPQVASTAAVIEQAAAELDLEAARRAADELLRALAD